METITTPANSPEPTQSGENPKKASLAQSLQALLIAKPPLRNLALVLGIVLIPVSVVALWYVWFKVLPPVWDWGFPGLSFRNIPGFFGVFFLAILPVYAPIGAVLLVVWVLQSYAVIATAAVTQAVERGSRELGEIEDDLAETDTSGLVHLLRYSRVQLEAYYRIGLTQTQRSFRYSVIAMWIGFGVIVAGIVIRVVDLQNFGLRAPDTDISTLVIGAGTIIEMVSALFLWVYRTSIRQLTYFYNRQMYNHSVLMCQRIADGMKESDPVKKTIVEKVLDRSWVLENEALPSGKQLLSFRRTK